MKVIFDADPGVDDFLAIALGVKSEKFDILGICTVEGNCSLDAATQNAFKALDMCGRSDIEVYKGLRQDNNTGFAEYAHGSNGLGGVEYEPISRKESDINAVDFMVDMVNKYPNEISIMALGPLTNIAACIRKDESFVKKVKSLLIMGGSAGKGNITPYAEYNFYKDPVAAKEVLSADFNEILVFGWDVTSKIPLLNEEEELLKNSNNEMGRFVYDITRPACEHDSKLYGGAVISDPLLPAYLLENSIVKLKPVAIEVIPDTDKAGMSVVSDIDESNTYMAYEADGRKFYRLLLDNILKD